MQQSFNINDLAYQKIIYHCLRFPSSKVYGALVSDEGLQNIVDAYPLFHTPLLAPSLSIALDIVESNLSEGQKLFGFYEYVEGSDQVMRRIIDSNQQMNKLQLLSVCTEGQSISIKNKKNNVKFPQFSSVKDHVKNGKHLSIVDFDLHFENIECDFKNLYLS